jgi:predicted amidohydrolase
LERKLGVEVILAPFKSPHEPNQRVKLWQKYLPTRAYDYRLSIVANNLIREKYGGHIGYDAKGDQIKAIVRDDLPVYIVEHFEEENGMKTIDFFNKRKEFRYIKLFFQTFFKNMMFNFHRKSSKNHEINS